VVADLHTVVKDPDYQDLGFRASSIIDDMAALAEFFVPGPYFIRIAVYFWLASKLLEVCVALSFSPFLGGKSTNIKKVFSGGVSE